MQWLSFPGANRLIELFPEFGQQDRDLLERRALPPWLRRSCRRDRRDSAIRKLAAIYLEMRPLASGRELARLIAAECRRAPASANAYRPIVDEILANSLPNRPPTAGTVRDALAGVACCREARPLTERGSTGRSRGIGRA